VQAFIDAEHAETTYDPRYQGWYDDRMINPGDVELPPLKPWPIEKVTAWLADWPPDGLGKRLDRFRECQGENDLLRGIGSGALRLKGPTFDYHGRTYTRRDVPRLVDAVEQELTTTRKEFDALDRQGFEAHWSAARHLDEAIGMAGREAELRDRYRFHMTVQHLLGALVDQRGRLAGVADFWVRNQGHVTEKAAADVRSHLADIQRALGSLTDDAKRVRTPAMQNVAERTSLYDLVADRAEARLPGLFTSGVSEDWLNLLASRLDAVLSRVKRVHFKSLGGLLAFQERLAQEWAAEQAAPVYAEAL